MKTVSQNNLFDILNIIYEQIYLNNLNNIPIENVITKYPLLHEKICNIIINTYVLDNIYVINFVDLLNDLKMLFNKFILNSYEFELNDIENNNCYNIFNYLSLHILLNIFQKNQKNQKQLITNIFIDNINTNNLFNFDNFKNIDIKHIDNEKILKILYKFNNTYMFKQNIKLKKIINFYERVLIFYRYNINIFDYIDASKYINIIKYNINKYNNILFNYELCLTEFNDYKYQQNLLKYVVYSKAYDYIMLYLKLLFMSRFCINYNILNNINTKIIVIFKNIKKITTLLQIKNKDKK